MRRLFDGLARAAREVIHGDPMSCHLFACCNRGKNRIKILVWDRSGFWLFAKRLEKGTFAWPQVSEEVRIDVVQAQRDEALRALKEGLAEIQKLRAQVVWLLKQLMGRKSERRPDLLTGNLFEDMPVEEAPAETSSEQDTEPYAPKRPRRKVGGRRRLPDDLPRKTTEILPPAKECHCDRCDVDKTEIGREVSERLEYHPGSLFVLREERVKMACPSCHEGVACAPLPARPIDRGLAGPGLLAFVLTSKYAEHGTLYRLEDILKRHGLTIARSTMCGWVGAAAMLLEPIVQEMRRELLAGNYVQSDDTGVRLLGGQKEGGSKRSHLWVYRWGKGLVIYDFTKSRSRDGPLEFLGEFGGYLQADAYSGYDVLFKSGRIKEVACWAHTRRYFIKAEDSDPELSTEMVGMIRALYRVERLAKDEGLTPEARLALRQERSVPILDAIKQWLDDKAQTVLPKSALGEAITYTLDPFAYFKDVLVRVSDTPQRRIGELTPRGWKAARDQSKAAVAALAATETPSRG